MFQNIGTDTNADSAQLATSRGRQFIGTRLSGKRRQSTSLVDWLLMQRTLLYPTFPLLGREAIPASRVLQLG